MSDLEKEKELCLNCNKCKLSSQRTNVVFGIGSTDSPILFVGEGPGQQEDLEGEPFVGAAGKLLDDMLSIIDLGRENCYIANIVKCRPPRNRDPEEAEIQACLPWLREQISILRPKMIICLGRIAAGVLIHPDYRITKEHGTFVNQDGIWLTSIYHPSALLRDYSKRPETFQDLLKIRSKIREMIPDFYERVSK